MKTYMEATLEILRGADECDYFYEGKPFRASKAKVNGKLAVTYTNKISGKSITRSPIITDRK